MENYISLPQYLIIAFILILIALIIILFKVITANSGYKLKTDSFKNTEIDLLNIKTNLENKVKEQLIEFNNKINEQTLNYRKKEAELKITYQNWAIEQFEKYKKTEIERIELMHKINAMKMANIKLQEWKIEKEAEIRKDAINRSYAVNLGKITEHLVPFHEVFLSQFNSKDTRFIGSPIDLIVFDGYSEKKVDLTIFFVEIKTGNSKLTDIQKRIKNAVVEGRIRWAEINPDNKTNITDISKSEYEEERNDILYVNSSEELRPRLFSLNDYDDILNIFIKYIKKGYSLS